MNHKEWIILNYKLPKEPSRVRVSIWRKLKKQGSVIMGQSTWILPADDEFTGFFNDIADEIRQNNGETYVMRAAVMNDQSTQEIIGLFNKARNDEYTEVLEKCGDFFREIEKETQKENFTYAELEENEYEYDKLVEWHKNIMKRDFFDASLKQTAEQELDKCKQLLEVFSSKIYDSNDR